MGLSDKSKNLGLKNNEQTKILKCEDRYLEGGIKLIIVFIEYMKWKKYVEIISHKPAYACNS